MTEGDPAPDIQGPEGRLGYSVLAESSGGDGGPQRLGCCLAQVWPWDDTTGAGATAGAPIGSTRSGDLVPSSG